MSKCPKLESLSLWKVTLSSSEDRSEDNRSLWSVYLPQIGNAFQAPESVSRVMIGFAVEDYRGARSNGSSGVKFANKVSVDGNGEKKFEDPEGKASYRKRVGSSVKDWLEDLGNRAFVEKPDLTDDSEVSEDDEDDDGEDGEDVEYDDGELDEDGGGEAEVIVFD